MNIKKIIKINLILILLLSSFSCSLSKLCDKKTTPRKIFKEPNSKKKNIIPTNPYGIKNTYILGDSLSDQGILIGEALKIATNGKDIKTELFYNGVIFSNGYPAVKQFAKKFQIPLEIGYEIKNICNDKFKRVGQNYAIAGARAYFPSRSKFYSKEKSKSMDLHLNDHLKKITHAYLHKSLEKSPDYHQAMEDHKNIFKNEEASDHKKKVKKVSDTLKKHKIPEVLKNHKMVFRIDKEEFSLEKEEGQHLYLLDKLKNMIRFYKEVSANIPKQIHLKNQFKHLTKHHKGLGSEDLVILIIGGNDIMYAVYNNDLSALKKAIKSIYRVISKLNKNKVKIILSNAPDLGGIPMYVFGKEEKRALAEKFSIEFNDILEKKIFKKKKFSNIKKLDLYEILNSLKKEISNPINPCIADFINANLFEQIREFLIGYFTGTIPSKKLENFDVSVFFDSVHPTKIANETLAIEIEKLAKKLFCSK